MNIFKKVTVQTLKQNKTRTLVTIIGVMLSAAMICAVTTFVSSMQNYILQFAVYNYGDWHAAVYDATFSDYTNIENNKQLSSTTYAQRIGYASIDSKNADKPYIYVLGGDKNGFFDIMPVHMLSGRLPENSTEIILPEHLAKNGGVFYKLGDTIEFAIGDIVKLPQANDESAENEETIAVRENKVYTVVGFYERPSFESYDAPGYTALTVADDSFTAETRLNIYFKMINAAQVYEFCAENNIDGIYNTDVLMYSGVSEYTSFNRVLEHLAIIVIALIMFGSVSLIYNAFSISVSERTKQFGLLSSLGATKRQLRGSVIFEAFAVSVVGIPLGIAVGIGGIGITLLIIGSKFTSLIANNFDVPLTICVSPQAVIIAAVVSLVTVLISAWIPSRRACKVSAIEAIRQNNDIKADDKPIKTSKLTYKLFGLSGVLAGKYYKRNRKKYRTTVFSLFMSIVLFISAASFTSYLTETVNGVLAYDRYDLYYAVDATELNGKTPDELLMLLGSDQYTTQSAYVNNGYFQGVINNDYLSDSFLSNSLPLAAENVGSNSSAKLIHGYIGFVNDEQFKLLLKENGLNESNYFNIEKPLGIALDNNRMFDAQQEKYVLCDTLKSGESKIECSSLRTFDGYEYNGSRTTDGGELICIWQSNTNENDTFELPYSEAYVSFTLCSEVALAQAPFYVQSSTSAHIQMLYPMSMLEYVLPQNSTAMEDFCYYKFYLLSSDHASSYNALKATLAENGLESELLVDNADTVDMLKNFILIIRVFAYGFIILISLIAAANVFNTIHTNISLRRREFAMLRSIGMTQKGFNKMMNYECLLYGSKALALGLPVSAVFAYLIYIAVSEGYETGYYLPWYAVGIAVFSVFAVVFVTMLYSMSKLRKHNTIDSLRNENM